MPAFCLFCFVFSFLKTNALFLKISPLSLDLHHCTAQQRHHHVPKHMIEVTGGLHVWSRNMAETNSRDSSPWPDTTSSNRAMPTRQKLGAEQGTATFCPRSPHMGMSLTGPDSATLLCLCHGEGGAGQNTALPVHRRDTARPGGKAPLISQELPVYSPWQQALEE